MANLKDLFVVDPGTFTAPVIFVESAPKYKFVQGEYDRSAPREQEKKNGLPVYHVTVMIDGYGALRVSIPSKTPPAFSAFSKVTLEGLRVGNGSKSFWAIADSIAAADDYGL